MAIDKDKKDKVWAGCEGVCAYCGCKMQKGNSKNGNSPVLFTVDHVLPKSKGGTDNIANLVGCCLSCNSKKAASLVADNLPTLKRHRPVVTPKGKIYLILQVFSNGEWVDATIEHITTVEQP